MANLRGLSKKLQTAILHCGLIVKINTYQFYSQEQKRMISKYQITTPVFRQNRAGEWKNMDYEILSTCSAVEVVECLNSIYQQMKGWKCNDKERSI